MVTSPVSTASQEVFWKHDGNAPDNCKFYGCDVVHPGVSFSFNDNPSANKIYKSFSIETPDLNNMLGAGVNTFIVNGKKDPASDDKRITINYLKNKGGILYGGVKGAQQRKANSRVFPAGTVEFKVEFEEFGSYFNFDPGVPAGSAYIKLSGPSSQYSGGDARLVTQGNIGLGVNPDPDVAQPRILYQYNGGYFVDSSGASAEGDQMFIAYRDIGEDMAKGQFADVSVTILNENDFEIHSFNVDFEPTTLDHNS